MVMGMEVKKALPISIIALIPDIDALFHIHRSISHSIIIPIIAGTLLIPYLKTEGRNLLALALLAVASHPILDLFTGYTPILWPLYNYSIWLQAEAVVHIGSTPTFSLSNWMLMEPTYFQAFQSLDAPLFTSVGLILSVMLSACLLFRVIRKKQIHPLR